MDNKKRIEILKKVKNIIRNRSTRFICTSINNELVENHGYAILDSHSDAIERIMKLFPELLNVKPASKLIYDLTGWWKRKAVRPRINALNSMIKEIKSNSQ